MPNITQSTTFGSAAGYGNLSNGVWSPVVFSQMAQIQFRKKSVVEDITNNTYMGEIKQFGDSVRIVLEPGVSVKPYKRGTQVSAQDLEDKDFMLVIDQANYFAFKADDIEEQLSHIDWLDLATDRAAYELKDHYDKEVLGYLSGYQYNFDTGVWSARTAPNGTNADSSAGVDELLTSMKINRAVISGGSASDSLAVGTAGTYDWTPLQILNRMNRLFDRKNVPAEGRWVVIDPVFKEKLLDENSKLVNTDWNQMKGEGLQNGRLTSGTIRGFRIYESNNLPTLGTGPETVDNNGSSANFGIIVAGHDSAVATASIVNKTEKLRDQDSFADVVRGLQMYARKILRPEAISVAAWNVAN